MPYDVTITRLPLRALFDLKGAAAALQVERSRHGLPPLPGRPNSRTEAAGRALLWIGADRWLLMASLEQEEALAAMLCHDAQHNLSVVLVSDTLTFFTVTGPQAAEVLAVATPLDLHSAVFAENSATWTEAFGTKALVCRIENGFEIAVDRSYADWFKETLARAAT